MHLLPHYEVHCRLQNQVIQIDKSTYSPSVAHFDLCNSWQIHKLQTDEKKKNLQNPLGQGYFSAQRTLTQSQNFQVKNAALFLTQLSFSTDSIQFETDVPSI